MSSTSRVRLGAWLLAAITTSAIAVAPVAEAGPRTHVSVNTIKAWDGESHVFPFHAERGTQTYGQTLTAPPRAPHLRSFKFMVKVPPKIRFRGYLYAWDETAEHARGPALWTERATSTSEFEWASINLHIDQGLRPGRRYVVFLTTVGLPQTPTDDHGIFAQPQESDLYPGGAFVYFNNDDFSALTTTPWDGGGGGHLGDGGDLAFKAKFSS